MRPKVDSTNIERTLRQFLLLACIEGLAASWLTLLIPADPKNAWFFGFSLNRLILFSGTLILSGVFLATYLSARAEREWIRRLTGFLVRPRRDGAMEEGLLSLLVVVLAGGSFFLLNAWWTPDEWVKGYLVRLSPFVSWVCLISLQTWIVLHRTRPGGLILYRSVRIASILLVPLLAIIILTVMFANPSYYAELAFEDSLLNWLTFCALSAAGIAAAMTAARRRGSIDRRFWFFVILSLSLFFFALEEISWGQRILGIESPEFFMRYSDQQEINVHNVLQNRLPFDTGSAVGLVLFVFGVILPLLGRIGRLRAGLNRMGLVPPPLRMMHSFFIGSLFTLDLRSMRDEEVGEFLLALSLLLYLLLEYLRSSQAVSPRRVRTALVREVESPD